MARPTYSRSGLYHIESFYRFPYLSTTSPETQALCPAGPLSDDRQLYRFHRMFPPRGSHRAARKRKSHHSAPLHCPERSRLSVTASLLLLPSVGDSGICCGCGSAPQGTYLKEGIFCFQCSAVWYGFIIQHILRSVVAPTGLVRYT